MSRTIIIGLTGAKYAGKDTAAKFLIDRGYQRLSFAGPLKAMIQTYLTSTVSRDVTVADMINTLLLEQGVAAYSRRTLLMESRQEPTTYLGSFSVDFVTKALIEWGQTYVGGDFWDDQGFGPGFTHEMAKLCIDGGSKEVSLSQINGKTTRHLMQTLGTEFGRQRLGETIWTDIGMCAAGLYPAVVFTDVRFDTEAQAIRNVGGSVYRVTRAGTGSGDAHATEAGVSPHLIEATLENDSTVEDLHQRFSSLVLQKTAA